MTGVGRGSILKGWGEGVFDRGGDKELMTGMGRGSF